MLIPLTITTFFSTLAGGLLALRFRDKLRLILGFSAGSVLGVCFFNLLPQALSSGSKYFDTGTVLSISLAGFMAYMILDRLTVLHFPHKDEQNSNRGSLAASGFSFHSFFDGIAIGLFFKLSDLAGISVAFAVIVHDLSDGMNTVTILLKRGKKPATAFQWLLINSIAPLLGVASTFLFNIREDIFVVLIALFAGFFLYIGASDLLPESQKEYSAFWATCMTLMGAGTIYAATHFFT